jgi:hypothetical protein
MALQSPQDGTDYSYAVSGHSVDRVGDYPVAFTIGLSTDNMADPAALAIVQQMVDLLAASALFVVDTAQRTHTRVEAISPTA